MSSGRKGMKGTMVGTGIEQARQFAKDMLQSLKRSWGRSPTDPSQSRWGSAGELSYIR